MSTTKNWFEVDRAGLAQILERRGKAAIVAELISNAFDEKVSLVEVSLEPIEGRPLAQLLVVDNSPDGWKNLQHAYTLFAPSEKKGNAEQRGRFNLGEKLVLAFCESATISTTTGGVSFDADGRHTLRRKREVGSSFTALVRMTREDVREVEEFVRRIVVPQGVSLWYNGTNVPWRTPQGRTDATLMTEIAGEDGFLRRVLRQTTLEFHEPRHDETATLYELGIPVVETGDKYHVNVLQKIPLTLDRENVLPSFLRDVRAATLNHMFLDLHGDEATATWVKEAIASGEAEPEAVTKVMTDRFGEKAVAYDPSDPEANALAASKGYTVVHGGSLSGEEWQAVRGIEGLVPRASAVTPSGKAIFSSMGTIEPLEEYEMTPGMKHVLTYMESAALYLLTRPVHVSIYPSLTSTVGGGARAAYGDGDLTLSLRALGKKWFEEPDQRNVDELLLHELAHDFEPNHFSSKYHDALCRLGAQLRHFDRWL